MWRYVISQACVFANQNAIFARTVAKKWYMYAAKVNSLSSSLHRLYVAHAPALGDAVKPLVHRLLTTHFVLCNHDAHAFIIICVCGEFVQQIPYCSVRLGILWVKHIQVSSRYVLAQVEHVMLLRLCLRFRSAEVDGRDVTSWLCSILTKSCWRSMSANKSSSASLASATSAQALSSECLLRYMYSDRFNRQHTSRQRRRHESVWRHLQTGCRVSEASTDSLPSDRCRTDTHSAAQSDRSRRRRRRRRRREHYVTLADCRYWRRQ